MRGRKILIVEDEMIVQMHLQRIVDELGHEVTATAASAREAFAAAEREAPELVLMDIHLSEDSDGVDTARALCERFDCAVIFITAYADEQTLERTAAVGAAGYLVKPFNNAAVRAAITTAFAGHGRLLKAQERERSLASVLISMGDAVFVTSRDGTISFANPRAADLTGWQAHEACDRDALEVIRCSTDSDAESLRAAMRRSLLRGEADSFSQLEILERGGGERIVSLDIEPVLEGESEPTGLILMLRDRTPGRRRAVASTQTTTTPFGEGTRLLVYSHDTFGLGHIRRCLNIIRGLLTRYPGLSALLVTGSPMVHRFKMPMGADYLKLPAVRKVSSERYEARSLSMPGSGIRTLRSNLLLRTIRDYDPNVLLVDHAPVGMKGEMRPSLEWLQSQGTCTRILGMRDIIDDPTAVVALWQEQGIYDVLQELYDHIVIYGSRELYDPVELYEFPEAVAAKTRFVNYVCDPAPPEDEPEDPEDAATPLVAVSIGGGDGGADAVIGSFLDMSERFRDQINFRAEVLTGPFLPPELEERFRAQVRDLPVVLTSFIASAVPLFRRADLVICTAGYNSATEIIANAKRAIIIPRILHRQEQRIRAQRMGELGLVTFLHPDEVTPERLFATITRALGDPAEPLSRGRAERVVKLDGTECFADFCGELQVTSRTTEPAGE